MLFIITVDLDQVGVDQGVQRGLVVPSRTLALRRGHSVLVLCQLRLEGGEFSGNCGCTLQSIQRSNCLRQGSLIGESAAGRTVFGGIQRCHAGLQQRHIRLVDLSQRTLRRRHHVVDGGPLILLQFLRTAIQGKGHHRIGQALAVGAQGVLDGGLGGAQGLIVFRFCPQQPRLLGREVVVAADGADTVAGIVLIKGPIGSIILCRIGLAAQVRHPAVRTVGGR